MKLGRWTSVHNATQEWRSCRSIILLIVWYIGIRKSWWSSLGDTPFYSSRCLELTDEAAEAIEEAFPGTVIDDKLRFRDFVRNTRACKLYDFDAGRWMTYREGRTSIGAAAEAA